MAVIQVNKANFESEVLQSSVPVLADFTAVLEEAYKETDVYRPKAQVQAEALDVMLQMEQDPAPIVAKLQGETGTDFVGKFKEF